MENPLLSQSKEPEEFTLTTQQSMIFNSDKRYRVVSAGRGIGKSELGILELFKFACDNPGNNVVYIAPTYRPVKRVFWKRLNKIVPKSFIKSTNKSDLIMTLKNGSEISGVSASQPDNLRGDRYDFVLFDEFAYISEEAWVTIQPTITNNKNARILMISTPNGFNHFYKFWQYGQDTSDKDWESWIFKGEESELVSEEALAAARKSMHPKLFKQEYEASFETTAGLIYYGFNRKFNVEPKIVDDGVSDIWIGMDFNVNPMNACITQMRKIDGKQCLVVLDEIVIPDSNTPEMIIEIKDRLNNVIQSGRKIYVVPDATGGRRDTRSLEENSDHKLLRDAGFIVKTCLTEANEKPCNPDTLERINNLNSLLLNTDNERRLFIDSKCETVIQSLQNQVWKEGTKLADKTQGWDHMNEALGYVAFYKFAYKPLKKPTRRSYRI